MKNCMTVYYDEEDGELAQVKVSKSFEAEHALMRADVLKDILEQLTDMYNSSLEGYGEELKSRRDAAQRQQ